MAGFSIKMRSNCFVYIKKSILHFIFIYLYCMQKNYGLLFYFFLLKSQFLSLLKAQIRNFCYSHFKLGLGNLSFTGSASFISLSFSFSSRSRSAIHEKSGRSGWWQQREGAPRKNHTRGQKRWAPLVPLTR